MASRVIGVDIGTTHIRAAEVEISGKPGSSPTGTVHSFAMAPVPTGVVADGEVMDIQAVASTLKQMWSRASFSHKQVVVGLGNSRTVVREMEVPAMPMQQLRTSLPFQVAEVLPMHTDEALLDFYPTSHRIEDGRELLRGIMVGAAKSAVANTILAIETAGLRPVGVDLNAFALQRAQANAEWNSQVIALVDIGARVTTVVIVAQGQPRLVRMLPAGGQDTTDAIASAMQISMPEAEQFKRTVGVGNEGPPEQQLARDASIQSTRQLVEGIRNTFVYFAGNNAGQAVQHAVLTGGGAYLPGLGQYLASASRLPVSFGSGLANVRVAKKAQGPLAGQETLVATVIGLALAEVRS